MENVVENQDQESQDQMQELTQQDVQAVLFEMCSTIATAKVPKETSDFARRLVDHVNNQSHTDDFVLNDGDEEHVKLICAIYQDESDMLANQANNLAMAASIMYQVFLGDLPEDLGPEHDDKPDTEYA